MIFSAFWQEGCQFHGAYECYSEKHNSRTLVCVVGQGRKQQVGARENDLLREFGSFGTHIADAQVRQLLRSVDTDGDGVIEYSEFVAMFGGLKEKPK